MIAFFHLVRAWWRRRQRLTDIEILWPVCVDMAEGDVVAARHAFAVHAHSDPAWLELGEDRINAYIAQMEVE